MEIANRFVRSATWEGLAAEDGTCTSQLTDVMVSLVRGGVGLIVTGHTYVRPEGQAGPRQLGIHNDEMVPGLTEMTKDIHESGGRIVLQMAHAGFYAATDLSEQPALAPSASPSHSENIAKEMTGTDIEAVVEAFGLAAERAKSAGFDGVQIHAGHGYMLNEFLSPAYNLRDDEYGGSLDNRARIVLEVLKRVREGVGIEYPVLVKLNSQDYLENGLDLKDSLQIAMMLDEKGIDAIELSGGTGDSGDLMPVRPGKLPEEKEGYYRDTAKTFKDRIGVPLILVGGIRSFPVAEKLVEDGVADYISMSRPFIREPGLVNRWKDGDREKAACVSDNQCFGPIMNGDGFYCVVDRKLKDRSAKQ